MVKKITVPHLFARLLELEKKVDERDLVIKDLQDEVVDLKTKLEVRVILDETVDNVEIVSAAEKPPPEEFDILYIGDSIVGCTEQQIKDESIDKKIKVECMRGARPHEVVDRYKVLRETMVFKKVVVHVGTNLIPSYSVESTCDRIVNCMEKIRGSSPQETEVFFSNILPKYNNSFLNGINRVNNTVNRIGISGHRSKRFKFISHVNFFADENRQVFSNFYSRDSVHLSPSGMDAFNNSFKSFLKLA